jgi:glycine/D-amino acid oxidase-like deaminating enzyme
MDTATRATQYWQNVEYLPAPPAANRPFTVVGIITPSGQFATEAEAVNALRQVAAQHGADAIFLEPLNLAAGKSPDWWSGVATVGTTYRAKAIAWGRDTP